MNLRGISGDAKPSWLARYQREILDLAALTLSLCLVRGLGAGVPLSGALGAFILAALVPLRPVGPAAALWSEFLAAAPRRIATVLVTGAYMRYYLGCGLESLWFGAAWPVLAGLFGLDWPRILTWTGRLLAKAWTVAARLCMPVWLWIESWVDRHSWLRNPTLGESLRGAFILVASLWLMRGFFRPTLHGAADAYWYGLNLADTIAQIRAGVFPVWVGQSAYQFNGAMCPIRVSPAFDYLGALVDALTFHKLGIFAVQNLLITIVGVAGMSSAYLGLRAILPSGKWLAAGLATLFLSCPGVLGLAYNTDLYMSWTTLPLVPVVWYATVRSFRDHGRTGTLALLGAALGLCWWGHSPIALWSTFLAGAAQLARFSMQSRDGVNWRPIAACIAILGLVAAYPVGSVLLFPPEPGGNIGLFQRATPGVIVEFLRGAFPGSFLPVSANGHSTSDFQVGYSLWAVLAVSVWCQRRALSTVSAVPLFGAALLALLILPIPGINGLLWYAVPSFVRNTTGNWAMSRLCILLAAAIVFAVAAYASSGAISTGRRRRDLALLVAVGCLWSLSESRKFALGSEQSAPAPETAVDMLRPENVEITRYSYSMFPHFPFLPSTFTHGVTDPELEDHLLARDASATIDSNVAGARRSASLEAIGNFRWNPNSEMSPALLDRTFRIEPGRSYLLEFEFARPDGIEGVLEIKAPHMFREYGLPEHGGPRAFGAGGRHASVLPLSTTAGEENLTLLFYPKEAASGGMAQPVAKVRLLSYDRNSLPVRVDSWIPYRARVRSPADAWLETPRAFQTGYRAWVDGKPAAVRESAEALVSVAVPAGASDVELAYYAPEGLKFLFWLSFLTIVGAVVFGGAKWILHLLGAPTPAKASEPAPGT